MKFLFSICLFLSLLSCTQLPTASESQDLDSEPANNIISVEPSISSAEISGCNSSFGFIPHMGTVMAYRLPQTTGEQKCEVEARICNNGSLSGSFENISCLEKAEVAVPQGEAFTSPSSN